MVIKKIDPKLRVIFFSFGILEQGGGFEDFMIETSAGLVSFHNIFDATIVTTTPKITERLQKLLAIYFLKSHSKKSVYREGRDNIEARLGQVRYVQARNLSELVGIVNTYDFIYVKNEILELIIMKLIKRRLNIKILIGIHTPIFYSHTPSFSAKIHNFLYTGKFYKWLLSDAEQIKVNNEDDKVFIVEHYGLTNVQVVHQAFDISNANQKKNNSKKLRVLFVGRITEQKGIDILLSIVDKLIQNDKMKEFEFKIAGSGERMLEDRINKVQNKYSNFEYLGHIEHDQINRLYDWTDITIIPSKYETLNKTAVETSVAAKISLCSDIPGPREVIDNNKTGYLVNLDVNVFYAKLIELSEQKKNNPKKLYSMGLKAQNKINREFNPETVYDTFYRQLLDC